MHLLLSRHRKRTLAAARLAAIYTAGVAILIAILFGAFTVAYGHTSNWREDLEWLAVTFTVVFGAAFLVLVAARRVGFTALWLIALSIWVLGTTGPQAHGPQPGPLFGWWSLLTLPLYLIGLLGFAHRAPTRFGRARDPAVGIGLMMWTGVALAGIFGVVEVWELAESGFVLLQVLGWAVERAWEIGPLVLTLDAIRRIHRRSTESAPSA